MRRVWGFCDDWEASIVGIRPVREIKTLVNEFEAASGQEVNKRKTTWLPNRAMSATERRALREHWPGAVVVDRQRVLGTPLGHGVTTTDFAASALEEFQHRIIAFSSSRLSFAMRVLAVNIFLYPLFSYVTRILILPVDVQNHIVNSAMRFVSRVPFCRATVLIHAKIDFVWHTLCTAGFRARQPRGCDRHREAVGGERNSMRRYVTSVESRITK